MPSSPAVRPPEVLALAAAAAAVAAAAAAAAPAPDSAPSLLLAVKSLPASTRLSSCSSLSCSRGRREGMACTHTPSVSASRGDSPALNRGSMSSCVCSVIRGPAACTSMAAHTRALGRAADTAAAPAAARASGVLAVASVRGSGAGGSSAAPAPAPAPAAEEVAGCKEGVAGSLAEAAAAAEEEAAAAAVPAAAMALAEAEKGVMAGVGGAEKDWEAPLPSPCGGVPSCRLPLLLLLPLPAACSLAAGAPPPLQLPTARLATPPVRYMSAPPALALSPSPPPTPRPRPPPAPPSRDPHSQPHPFITSMPPTTPPHSPTRLSARSTAPGPLPPTPAPATRASLSTLTVRPSCRLRLGWDSSAPTARAMRPRVEKAMARSAEGLASVAVAQVGEPEVVVEVEEEEEEEEEAAEEERPALALALLLLPPSRPLKLLLA